MERSSYSCGRIAKSIGSRTACGRQRPPGRYLTQTRTRRPPAQRWHHSAISTRMACGCDSSVDTANTPIKRSTTDRYKRSPTRQTSRLPMRSSAISGVSIRSSSSSSLVLHSPIIKSTPAIPTTRFRDRKSALKGSLNSGLTSAKRALPPSISPGHRPTIPAPRALGSAASAGRLPF